jgi:glycerol-3-phosphate dehydrogenase subunit B
MDISTDALIIGGGMAGLVAGTTLAEDGVETLVLQKGQSATAYSSGCVDVIGYLPDAVEPLSSPIEGLTAISSLYPLHPYGVAGYLTDMGPEELTNAIIDEVRKTLDWLRAHTKGTMAPLSGDIGKNIFPITVLGTSKPTCLLQETMLPSQEMLHEDESVLVFAGIKGYPDFNPGAAAKTYLRDRMMNMSPPKKVVHGMIEVAPFGKSYNISGAEIARHLDHEGAVNQLIGQLRPHIEQFGATDVALPPVLGVRMAVENKALIEEQLGVRAFELLGFPPSIPGLRLQKSLERVFVKRGGKLLRGHEAISYSADKGLVTSITTRGPSRNLVVTARVFILATGKFIGGGLDGDEHGIRETVFGLMTVTSDFFSAERAVPTRSTSRVAISPIGQPLYSSGLSADPHLRPITTDGTQWAANLFCAGSILAGYNFATEKSGLGVAATTGHVAAEGASVYLKGGEL